MFGVDAFFSNFSIVLGCLLVSPVMYYADFRMGTARILPRLLSFSVVPLASFIIFFLSRSEKLARKNKFVNSYSFAIFAVLSLVAGSLSAVALLAMPLEL